MNEKHADSPSSPKDISTQTLQGRVIRAESWLEWAASILKYLICGLRGVRAAIRRDGKRQEKELDWCWLNEPIFSESMKVMTQWKRFDKSHYTKPEPVWLQRAAPQSVIISLWESGRQKQSQRLCILLWLLSPVLQSKAISSTITESYIHHFFPECLHVKGQWGIRSTEHVLHPCLRRRWHFIHTLKTIVTALWLHFIRDAFMNLNFALIITYE